jgi:hypothetical protein
MSAFETFSQGFQGIHEEGKYPIIPALLKLLADIPNGMVVCVQLDLPWTIEEHVFFWQQLKLAKAKNPRKGRSVLQFLFAYPCSSCQVCP